MSGYINKTLFCAPNHNARKVLSSYTGMNAVTIHKLLKIKPESYETEITFARINDDGVDPLMGCRILIVDEISFVDEMLFDLLLREIPNDCIIVGLGNVDQLKPIPPKDARNKTNKHYVERISPFFDDDRFYKLALTEVRRSASPVAVVGEAIRKEVMTFPMKSYLNDDGVGVHITRNLSDFLGHYYDHVKSPEDFKNNRMVALSNDDVDRLNIMIRKKIYGTSDQFVDGEILVAQAPYFECDDIRAYENNQQIIETMLFQNGTYLEVVESKSYTESIKVENIPEFEIRGYELKLQELDVFFEKEVSDNGEVCRTVTVNVLSEDSVSDYKHFIDRYAKELQRQKARKERPNWRMYFYYAKKKFLEYKYLPACTIHKSQGITVDNVFYYVDYVRGLPDQDFARRLSYVAVTRARHNSFLMY